MRTSPSCLEANYSEAVWLTFCSGKRRDPTSQCTLHVESLPLIYITMREECWVKDDSGGGGSRTDKAVFEECRNEMIDRMARCRFDLPFEFEQLLSVSG